MYKEDLALSNLQWLICHKTQPKRIIYIYIIYMYKEDLALSNLQWLICHKTQPKPKHRIRESSNYIHCMYLYFLLPLCSYIFDSY